MLKQIKNLARHSSIYTLSTFAQKALGFVMMPFYTDPAYLPHNSDYGDMALVYTFIAFMTIIYLYGMDLALMRYFFLGKFRRKDVYTTAFVGVLLNGVVLSALLMIFAGSLGYVVFGSARYAPFIRIAAGILFLESLGNLPYLILRAEEKSTLYSVVRVGRFLLELSLDILLVVIWHKGVLGILYANLIAAFINVLVLLPYQLKYLSGRFIKDAFRTLVRFGLPMLPNGLAYLTVEVSDKYLMRLLLDKDAIGTYAANRKFGSLMLFVVMAFRTAWQPFFLKVAKEESDPQHIYSKVMTYFVLVASWLVIFGTYFLEYILRIPFAPGRYLMGSAYWSGMSVIPIILTAYLFYGLYVNLTVGIYIKKKTGMMVVFTGLAALVDVGSNFYLMPHFGIIGAAWATLLSYMTMAASIYIATRRIYPVPYEYKRIGLLFMVLIAALFGYYFMNLTFLWRLLIVMSIPAFLLLGGFFKPEESRAVLQMFRRNEG